MEKVIAFIFARGGSKGLKDKNIRQLAGKPLIGWAIEQAQAVQRISRVIVSTDSKQIASVAKDYGAEVPFMRPSELAQDDAPEWLSWRHALQYLMDTEGVMPDVMLSIPTTAPLRQPIDIDNCLDEFTKGDCDVVVTVTDSHRNPWFNMVQYSNDNLVKLLMTETGGISRRQDAPTVYDMTTVAYVARSDFVMKHENIFEGRVRAVRIPVERSVDIDTLLDFEIAEFLAINKKREK